MAWHQILTFVSIAGLQVGEKYSTVLQRRIAASNGSYDSVRAAIDKVDELANIFQNLQMF